MKYLAFFMLLLTLVGFGYCDQSKWDGFLNNLNGKRKQYCGTRNQQTHVFLEVSKNILSYVQTHRENLSADDVKVIVKGTLGVTGAENVEVRVQEIFNKLKQNSDSSEIDDDYLTIIQKKFQSCFDDYMKIVPEYIECDGYNSEEIKYIADVESVSLRRRFFEVIRTQRYLIDLESSSIEAFQAACLLQNLVPEVDVEIPERQQVFEPDTMTDFEILYTLVANLLPETELTSPYTPVLFDDVDNLIHSIVLGGNRPLAAEPKGSTDQSVIDWINRLDENFNEVLTDATKKALLIADKNPVLKDFASKVRSVLYIAAVKLCAFKDRRETLGEFCTSYQLDTMQNAIARYLRSAPMSFHRDIFTSDSV